MKIRLRHHLLSLLSAILLCTQLSAVQTGTRYVDPMFAVNIDSDIEYSSIHNPWTGVVDDLVLDIYTPIETPAPVNRPILFWTHGGRFLEGSDKQEHAVFAQYFAERGYVCITINYRVCPDPLQGTAEDAAQLAGSDLLAAARWARINAATYSMDPNRIAFCGSSAGAMASLAAALVDPVHLRALNPSHLSITDDSVQAIVEVSGATDVSLISPNTPPICVIHGGNDQNVNVQNAHDIKDRCDEPAINVHCTKVIKPGVGHGIAGNIQGQAAINSIAQAFLFNYFI